MLNEFERYKYEIKRIMKDMARQDFTSAVDKLECLIESFDYILKYKTIVVQETLCRDGLNDKYGMDGLTVNLNYYNILKELDIENFKIKNIYFRDNQTLYLYDSENRKWDIDSIRY